MAGGVKQDLGRSREGDRESGEEGGEGKVVYIRRGRVVLRGAQMDEVLFRNLNGTSVRPEGSFKSRGSSDENIFTAIQYSPKE